MAPHRRRGDSTTPSGASAVILVAPDPADDPSAVGLACRHALRDTDAVIARGDNGITSALLRNVGAGAIDAATVAERVREVCIPVTTVPVRLGIAVAATADEPLDILLRRAERALTDTVTTPPT